jgi:coenzyme F420 hydrogenase subunit beta
MASAKDISGIVKHGLCHSCGGCAGICQQGAVGFEETPSGLLFPVIDTDRCTECGLCVSVCPGMSLGDTLAGMLPADPFIGESVGSYVGRSTDERTFLNSQSGGIATELLLHALRTGEISCALVVTMNRGVSPRAQASIATNEEAIIAGQKSKYCPVPLLEALGKLDDMEGPAAVAGLPCQIHGLIKAAATSPEIKKKVKYRIGLICDRVLSFAAIDHLAMKAGAQKDGEKALTFRDKSRGGYPGDVHVTMPGGRSVVLGDGNRIRIKKYLTPPRCHLCFDKMNVFSDITIGDPHGIRSADRINGESTCIVRNQRGSGLVDAAVRSGSVNLREISYADIVCGQKIDRKRALWRGFCEEWLARGKAIPDYYPIIKRSAPTSGPESSRRAADLAARLVSFDSRDELLGWLGRKDRKEGLLYPFRRLCGYPTAIARKILTRKGAIR